MKDPENQKFAGEILARGGIELEDRYVWNASLSAGIGIASGFTKKSTGSPMRYLVGFTEVDENGNATRDNDGWVVNHYKNFPLILRNSV